MLSSISMLFCGWIAAGALPFPPSFILTSFQKRIFLFDAHGFYFHLDLYLIHYSTTGSAEGKFSLSQLLVELTEIIGGKITC